MPARWQSSERPLFVRTVWVNGLRHAILSTDDPLLQYTPSRLSSSSCTSETSSVTSGCCQLETCLVKLRLALQPDSLSPKDTSIYPIKHGTVESTNCYDHRDDDSCGFEDIPQRLPLLGQYSKVYSYYQDDNIDNTPFLPELQLNPLSERVLQWLDLSGKGKRLNTPLGSRDTETKKFDRRKNFIIEPRRSHVLRRREFPTRSLSMDALANTKIFARSADVIRKNHDNHLTKSAVEEEVLPNEKGTTEEPPVVQNFEPPRMRPVSAWPQPTTPNKPQLHIFMPPLDDGTPNPPEDNSECGSTVSEQF